VFKIGDFAGKMGGGTNFALKISVPVLGPVQKTNRSTNSLQISLEA
jgi:hypothetical protein